MASDSNGPLPHSSPPSADSNTLSAQDPLPALPPLPPSPPPASERPAHKKFASTLSVNKRFLQKASGDGKTPPSKPSSASSSSSRPASTSPVPPPRAALPVGPTLLTGRTLQSSSPHPHKPGSSSSPGDPSHSSQSPASTSTWNRPVFSSDHPPSKAIVDSNSPFPPRHALPSAPLPSRSGPNAPVWSRQAPSSGPPPPWNRSWIMPNGDFPSVEEAARAAKPTPGPAAGRNKGRSQQQSGASEAHNKQLLQELEAFRGTHHNPNAPHWDEMDEDEGSDAGSDEIDFGDGQTYKIHRQDSTTKPPEMTKEEEDNDSSSRPVAQPKTDRFGDDYDRSSTREASSYVPLSAPRPKSLFNDRLGKLEPYAGRPGGSAFGSPGDHHRKDVLHRPSQLDHQHPLSKAPPPNAWPRATAVLTPSSSTSSSHPPPPPSTTSATSASSHLSKQAPQYSHKSPQSPSAPSLPPPAVVLDEQVQHQEMLTAAERARRRRQEEEDERQAQRERAQKRAKELEDKINAQKAEKAEKEAKLKREREERQEREAAKLKEAAAPIKAIQDKVAAAVADVADKSRPSLLPSSSPHNKPLKPLSSAAELSTSWRSTATPISTSSSSTAILTSASNNNNSTTTASSSNRHHHHHHHHNHASQSTSTTKSPPPSHLPPTPTWVDENKQNNSSKPKSILSRDANNERQQQQQQQTNKLLPPPTTSTTSTTPPALTSVVAAFKKDDVSKPSSRPQSAAPAGTGSGAAGVKPIQKVPTPPRPPVTNYAAAVIASTPPSSTPTPTPQTSKPVVKNTNDSANVTTPSQPQSSQQKQSQKQHPPPPQSSASPAQPPSKLPVTTFEPLPFSSSSSSPSIRVPVTAMPTRVNLPHRTDFIVPSVEPVEAFTATSLAFDIPNMSLASPVRVNFSPSKQRTGTGEQQQQHQQQQQPPYSPTSSTRQPPGASSTDTKSLDNLLSRIKDVMAASKENEGSGTGNDMMRFRGAGSHSRSGSQDYNSNNQRSSSSRHQSFSKGRKGGKPDDLQWRKAQNNLSSSSPPDKRSPSALLSPNATLPPPPREVLETVVGEESLFDISQDTPSLPPLSASSSSFIPGFNKSKQIPDIAVTAAIESSSLSSPSVVVTPTFNAVVATPPIVNVSLDPMSSKVTSTTKKTTPAKLPSLYGGSNDIWNDKKPNTSITTTSASSPPAVVSASEPTLQSSSSAIETASSSSTAQSVRTNVGYGATTTTSLGSLGQTRSISSPTIPSSPWQTSLSGTNSSFPGLDQQHLKKVWSEAGDNNDNNNNSNKPTRGLSTSSAPSSTPATATAVMTTGASSDPEANSTSAAEVENSLKDLVDDVPLTLPSSSHDDRLGVSNLDDEVEENVNVNGGSSGIRGDRHHQHGAQQQPHHHQNYNSNQFPHPQSFQQNTNAVPARVMMGPLPQLAPSTSFYPSSLQPVHPPHSSVPHHHAVSNMSFSPTMSSPSIPSSLTSASQQQSHQQHHQQGYGVATTAAVSAGGGSPYTSYMPVGPNGTAIPAYQFVSLPGHEASSAGANANVATAVNRTNAMQTVWLSGPQVGSPAHQTMINGGQFSSAPPPQQLSPHLNAAGHHHHQHHQASRPHLSQGVQSSPVGGANSPVGTVPMPFGSPGPFHPHPHPHPPHHPVHGPPAPHMTSPIYGNSLNLTATESPNMHQQHHHNHMTSPRANNNSSTSSTGGRPLSGGVTVGGGGRKSFSSSAFGKNISGLHADAPAYSPVRRESASTASSIRSPPRTRPPPAQSMQNRRSSQNQYQQSQSNGANNRSRNTMIGDTTTTSATS